MAQLACLKGVLNPWSRAGASMHWSCWGAVVRHEHTPSTESWIWVLEDILGEGTLITTLALLFLLLLAMRFDTWPHTALPELVLSIQLDGKFQGFLKLTLACVLHKLQDTVCLELNWLKKYLGREERLLHSCRRHESTYFNKKELLQILSHWHST